MKLATYQITTAVGAYQGVGALYQGKVVDLTLAYASYLKEVEGEGHYYDVAAARMPRDMVQFFKGGGASRRAAEAALAHVAGKLGAGQEARGPRGERLVYDMEDIRLLAPVPRPNSIRDTLSFEMHLKNALGALGLEVPSVWYEIPTYYRSSPDTVIGPGEPILWPSFTEKLDYELEFGLFIGKEGKNIPRERASEYVAGYTIFNDVSARDILAKELALWVGPAKGKNFEHSNVLGPCLVTPDELDPDNLKMVARVNGEVWSEGNSRDMYWKFPVLIEYISREETLYPGDFIGSGTVGYGCCLELGRWIKPGDAIELEVEGIGVLRNRVERR